MCPIWQIYVGLATRWRLREGSKEQKHVREAKKNGSDLCGSADARPIGVWLVVGEVDDAEGNKSLYDR